MSTETAAATRAQLIDAAAQMFERYEYTPHWGGGEDDRMNSAVELIARTTDPDNTHDGRSQVWDEIDARHKARKVEAEADAYTERVGQFFDTLADGDITSGEVHDAIRAAYLAGKAAQS